MSGDASVGILLRGMALGLGAAAPIGPVNLEIARRTLRHGFSAGFALGCGAVSVDVGYAILTSLSMRPLLDRPGALRVVGLAGGLLLVFLGVMSLRGAVGRHELKARPAARAHTNYVTGLLMTSLNPMTLLFWFLAVPGSMGRMLGDTEGALPLVCLGVFLAALTWVCCFAGLLARLGQWKSERWLRVADAAGGMLLLGFAATALWHAVRG